MRVDEIKAEVIKVDIEIRTLYSVKGTAKRQLSLLDERIRLVEEGSRLTGLSNDDFHASCYFGAFTDLR